MVFYHIKRLKLVRHVSLKIFSPPTFPMMRECNVFTGVCLYQSDLLIAKNSTGLIHYVVQPRIEIRTEKDIIKLLLLIENEEKVKRDLVVITITKGTRLHL